MALRCVVHILFFGNLDVLGSAVIFKLQDLLILIKHVFLLTEKGNGPKTVKDLKLISAGRILENSTTVGECRNPLCDIPGGVTTMHVVVQPTAPEKGSHYYIYFTSNLFVNRLQLVNMLS